MDKRYQVFVSSTFDDLRSERLAVSNVLAKAGYFVAGMELFPATDQKQFEYIKTVIDRSDYYVVIVGARYGSLDDSGISFTQMEYEYARKKGLPVLSFLHSDPGQIAHNKTEQSADSVRKLEQFRSDLRSGRLVEGWLEISDLQAAVLTSVVNETTLKPGVGWVRGDQAVDAKVLQEAERLRIENTELNAKIAQISEGGFDPTLLGPNDNFELQIVGRLQDRSVIWKNSFEIPLGKIYDAIFDRLIQKASEADVSGELVKLYVDLTKAKFPPETELVDVQDENLTALRTQFEALGLVRGEHLVRAFGAILMWYVTEKGRRFVINARAIRKHSN